MAASIETQRLISVSLGKIAQSRGQRGGINLHKNLLVATVLHKARTAYMMESYGYQQTLQRQKLQEQQQQQQQQQQVQPPVQVATSTPVSVPDKGEEVCQAPRDSNLGQPAATPARSAESGSESSTVTALEAVAPEPMTVHEVESEVAQDKENSPPVSAERLISLENVTTLNGKTSSDDHLAAATQLSQEAQSASEHVSVKQQNLTSATPTCNNVLKRRRDNPKAGSQDYECPVSKKARVSYESSYTFTDYSSDFSDISSDESESDSESESDMMQTSDSPQISNLVSIFNSGFSGLCAVSQDTDLSSSDYQSDLDISSSTTQLSSLSKLRSESPSPAYSRKMSEPSLLCSSQVGRLESLPSAILLSA